MLFFTRTHDALQRALRAAIAAHRPLVLRELLASHGETAFAAALSPCTGRVIADALSMLPRQESDGVLRQLSGDAQARQRSTCDSARAHRPQEAALTRPSLQGILVWSRHA
jgi:hypothetical protein